VIIIIIPFVVTYLIVYSLDHGVYYGFYSSVFCGDSKYFGIGCLQKYLSELIILSVLSSAPLSISVGFSFNYVNVSSLNRSSHFIKHKVPSINLISVAVTRDESDIRNFDINDSISNYSTFNIIEGRK
jgi:hypothetical protein